MNLEIGQYLQVYYNLHKHCLSVQNRKRKVIGYCDEIRLTDVEFFVSEAGRQRVLKEKRKNVHAKVRGLKGENIDVPSEARKVRYNPYKFDSFVYADTEEPVYSSDNAIVKGSDVYVWENDE